MERVAITPDDMSDFLSFTSQPGVKLLSSLKSAKFLEMEYNTNQKFLVPLYLAEKAGLLSKSAYLNPLIFGKDTTENIVSIEVQDDVIILYKETAAGVVTETRDNKFWLITPKKVSSSQELLAGNQFYKYIAQFTSLQEYKNAKYAMYGQDYYTIHDSRESALVFNGLTYFKGMKPSDVSILSFDIEGSGLVRDKTSTCYLISNTFRRNGITARKIFCLDEYESQRHMIEDWCEWVRKMDPSILCGHNLYGYDLDYLNFISQRDGYTLCLGRDESDIQVASKPSKFRKDGSQSYEYTQFWIRGREIVDTMFLALKYDVGRKYESYGLKAIIKFEGLERENRAFVDAKTFKKIYDNRLTDPETWTKAKEYCIDDGDDALKLFDLMAPSYFYFTQSVSKTFQQMVNSATGSQVNNMMVRAYLQNNHSIAKADDNAPFEGALSFGLPGLYKNAFKVDVASLYPSLIRHHKIYNKQKDPEMYFLKMIEYFTLERLKNKKIAKETKEKYYSDLEQSQKILINSGYGFLGAPGLNYNYSLGASLVTRYGREVLDKALVFATGKSYEEWRPEEEAEEPDEE